MGYEFKQEFTFIVDGARKNGRRLHDDEEYAYNRRFVKELDLKCDSVGWSTVKEPELTVELLEKIREKAKKEKVSIRGMYSAELPCNMNAEWYRINSKDAIDDSWEYENQQMIRLCVPAYKQKLSVIYARFTLFSEKIIDVLKDAGVGGFDTVWVQDSGKYKGTQYFAVIPEVYIPYVFDGWIFKEKSRFTENPFEDFGPVAEKIWDICDDIQNVMLPVGVNRELTKSGGIAGFDDNYIMVSKEVRKLLIEKNALRAEDFQPVILFDCDDKHPPKGWLTAYCDDRAVMSPELAKYNEAELEKHKKKIKPERKVTEKMAVAELRQAKQISPEYFYPGIRGTKLEALPHESLVPYYKVSNGGCLSDEFYFSSVQDIEEEQRNFDALQAQDEQCPMQDKITLFGSCINGDYVGLLEDGRVVRYSAGYPDFDDEWENIHSFFYDVLSM